jgi:hypothetical protein
MSTINWKNFSLKYDQKETTAFEDLSYLLFCAELENRIGLFRYKNQTGIETEPIIKDGVVYGFQSKYYSSSISSNKAELIESIKKTKRENSSINKILFYLNQEFSESTKPGIKKPKYQSEIENEAKKLDIEIDWRVPSHFELQLSLPENYYIHDLFFSLVSNSGDLVSEVKRHAENILLSIKTEISFNGQVIKIDRNDEVLRIKQSLFNKDHLIISGEGGCGKTAIVKDFYSEFAGYPVCIFKATELNVSNLNDLFRFTHNYSFDQFINTYKSEPDKLFIIDSAEKLAEFNNSEILQYLIRTLEDEKWTIIFTTRYCYLDDLQFHIRQTYQLPCDISNITHLNDEELLGLSVNFNFKLPDNLKFRDRIKNLFYLSEYLNEYKNIDREGNFNSFIDLIWKKRIQNIGCQNDNIHLEREKCLLEIAKERCTTGLFYISSGQKASKALFQLKQDEILGYDEWHDGYFITHDIYEEWALDKIIIRAFANKRNSIDFLNKIGESLPMRRAFRDWISDQISDDIENIEEFIKDSFSEIQISQFWKDELIVSILLSEYAKTFFTQFEKEIIANNFNLLNRILFLLRIACNEIDNSKNIESSDYINTLPKGKGWKATIEFIYNHREIYFENHLKLILPILTDWVKYNREGSTTKFAGLLALSIIEKRAKSDHFYIEEKTESTILKIIYNSAKELINELKNIFDLVITNKWTSHNAPYEELCSLILKEPYLAVELIRVLPTKVIQLCDLFWQHEHEDDDRFPSYEMEERYGLTDEFRFDYFPSSAFQTPIYWLLQNSLWETLEFIIDFTNRSVEIYSNSDYGKEDVKQVALHLEDKEIYQHLSWALWGMYRGIGNPVTPYLLQSIHMSLEKILLEYANILDSILMEKILISILTKSKSTSLTAIVCSVVLANPDKLNNVALVLFKTLEFFHMDTTRSSSEFEAKTLYSFGCLPNKQFYTEERLKTCEEKHRNLNLEALFVNYQFLGIKDANEEENETFIKTIYAIIDQHKITIQSMPKEKQITLGILLARTDRRKMHPEIKKQEATSFFIELNPELSPELKEHSERAIQRIQEQRKYVPLMLWGISKFQENGKPSQYSQYEDKPLNVIKEVNAFFEEVKNGQYELGPTDDYIPSFACSALIRFYHSELSSEDLTFCKEVVLERISDIFRDDYGYQISDGVEASIHAIPQLIKLFPEEIPLYQRILLFALFDNNKIGEYKRICDYVIETINQENLWEDSFEDTKSLLYAYVTFSPLFNKFFDEEKSKSNFQFGRRRILKQKILEKVEEQIKEVEFDKLLCTLSELESLSVHNLVIAFQLVSTTTQSIELLDVIRRIIPLLSDLLVKKGKHDRLYMTRIHVFRKFSFFILNRDVSDIKEFLSPFITKISSNEESASFVSELVAAEDKSNKVEQFWVVWRLLYDAIINKDIYGYYSDNLIIDYMLAWRWWTEGIEEWHSLGENNLWLYENAAKELGNHPAVLYSISRVLNSIGSHFINQGTNWIYTIVSKNKNLEMKDLESNTIFYLERLMRKFIFLNKERIKREIRLKNRVIPILDFMIERGSVHGYLLRESIL